MSALDGLKGFLSTVNGRFVIDRLGNPKAISRTVEVLEATFGQGRAPDSEMVLKTLRQFLQTRLLSGYREIRNACYGLILPVQGNRTIASSLDTMELLLRYVDAYQAEPKKLKRCFQALLSAYLSLDGCDQQSERHAQWNALRLRLRAWLPRLKDVQPRPDWLAAAFEHKNLFDDDPTGRYGASVLIGDRAEFDTACEQLGVGPTSWVRRRVVISAVDAATAASDSEFIAYIDKLIEVLKANPGVRDEGAAKLLNRYSQQNASPEHMHLRTFAIEAFGNPLITANRQRWFEVSQDAREMVANWLKGFLIERFFELLSHDGLTDKRRPQFWLRYRGSMESMWFILGTSAMSSWNVDFKKLRETMGNQCLRLEGATAGNNAFVMKIGKIYVVEFGEKGNATFVFNGNDLPFDLTGKYLYLSWLKSTSHMERLLHMDGRDTWEEKFADALAHYGVYPDDAASISRRRKPSVPATTTGGVFTPPNFHHIFKQFCNERGLRYDDRTPGGLMVVYADSSNSYVSGKLGQWGFTYDRARRRWIKNP